MLTGPVDRFLVGHRGNCVVPAVVPTSEADHCQQLDDLTVGVVLAQCGEMLRLDGGRYERGVPGKTQRRLLSLGEIA